MKRTLSIFIALILIFSLSSCSSTKNVIYDRNDFESNNESNTSQETDVSTETKQTVVIPDKRFHFVACPDNIIHPSVYYGAVLTAAEKKNTSPAYYPIESADFDFSEIYKYVADEIGQADLSYINVETMIGGSQYGISGYPQFNTPEANGEMLCQLGFDVYNVAHNHMLDSGNDLYLKNCYDFFTTRGKTVIGYYSNTEALNNIVVTETNGIKVAWLAYTYDTNGIRLNSAKYPTYIPYFDDAIIEQQVKIAKTVADFVFVSAHWGVENSYNVNSAQMYYSNLFTKLDVDVVLGMHPHCIQPMTWAENSLNGHRTLVIYSLGNFVSGMLDGLNMLGGIIKFDVILLGDGTKYLDNIYFEPIVTHYDKVPLIDNSDTGYRHHVIYYLKDYNDTLASQHYVTQYEKRHKTTLIGGPFNIANLYNTVRSIIPSNFLEECYR